VAGAQTAGPPKTEGRENGSVNDYEILLMLDLDAPEERHEEILKRTRELVEKDAGNWEGHEPWGRRRLAYEIDKKSEGSYHLLMFRCAPATLDEISRVLKITDGVMRHMATRRLRASRRPAPAPDGRAARPAQESTPVAEEGA
jgi:small subunit ribosomal protein S6